MFIKGKYRHESETIFGPRQLDFPDLFLDFHSATEQDIHFELWAPMAGPDHEATPPQLNTHWNTVVPVHFDVHLDLEGLDQLIADLVVAHAELHGLDI